MAIGQYSFLVSAVVAWLLVGYWLLQHQSWPAWLRIAASLILGVALIGVWVVIQPTDTAGVTSEVEADQLIGAGKPTVLEFFSEY